MLTNLSPTLKANSGAAAWDTQILPLTQKNLEHAAALIKRGEPVAFGTETVYGLGANAFDGTAVKKIFAAKGRPGDNPLIVHLPRVEDIAGVAEIDGATLDKLSKIMPAPLTVILPKKDLVPYAVTAGLETVAVRVPASKEARDFLTACGLPIAAPSANTSTRPSPTCARHVYDDLNGKIPLILDMGECQIGVESTVLDMTSAPYRVLRLGGMSVELLRQIFGQVDVPVVGASDKPMSPGMKYKHYAPAVPLVLYAQEKLDAMLSDFDAACVGGENPVIFAAAAYKDKIGSRVFCTLGRDADSAANKLFALMRGAEKKYSKIFCLELDPAGVGRAVNNRLQKAAGGAAVR